jgi:hypothetical protein
MITTGDQLPSIPTPPREGGSGLVGTTLCDTQADVPSTERLRAQLAFKDSMVHGILQFTPSIAFCYVLHRWESRDIRCRESFSFDIRRNIRVLPVWEHRKFPPSFVFLGAFCAGVGVVPACSQRPHNRLRQAKGKAIARPTTRHYLKTVHRSFCWAGFDNDPSAGSPTETLLRLLLPLNDKVQWTSRDVAGSEPPTSPRSEHFTGPFNR